MAIAGVSVSFECADLADAEAKISAWNLHEGCEINTTVMETAPDSSGVVQADGTIVSLLELAEVETNANSS